jgi:Uma2 family endonuclease
MITTGILRGRHVELLDGDIVEMTPEGEPHAYCSDEAGEYLSHILGDRAKVRQNKPITLPQNDSEPAPDLSVVQRLGQEYRDHHPYPQNIFWLVEYADSSLQEDLFIKTRIYAEVEIPEYWVVNLKTSQLIMFRRPRRDGYQYEQILTQGTITPLAFPDMAISVERLLGF